MLRFGRSRSVTTTATATHLMDHQVQILAEHERRAVQNRISISLAVVRMDAVHCFDGFHLCDPHTPAHRTRSVSHPTTGPVLPPPSS